MSTFVLNVPPNRNFGDAIAVQDLRGIQYEIFFWCFPSNQNPGAALVNSTLQWFSNWGTRVICDTLTKKLWHCLYLYVTLLTQRCKENDTQADKSQNHWTYIVENVQYIVQYMYTTVRTCNDFNFLSSNYSRT